MIKHLGLKSSFIAGQLSSLITHKAGYSVVRTPSRPDFFWGNYLIFHEKPTQNNSLEWIDCYKGEFDLNKQRFMTITWDSSDKGDLSELVKLGFELETQEVLILEKIVKPEKMNTSIVVKIIESDSDWKQVKRTQWIHDWPLKEAQLPFLESKISAFRDLQNKNCGKRFGAYIGDKLVGDLGIYYQGKIARFSSVCTDKDYYNQGVCRTLVYSSIAQFQKIYDVDHFVMQATETEYAKNIYKKLGFTLWGYSHDLTWLRR
jgi:hypothetical protein